MIEESRNMTGEEENAEIKLATIGDIADTKGKILAVDFGDVRTGIAISDERRSFAFGNCTVSVGGMRKTAEKVAKKVGIKTFFSELLPENKVEKVEQLIKDRCRKQGLRNYYRTPRQHERNARTAFRKGGNLCSHGCQGA